MATNAQPLNFAHSSPWFAVLLLSAIIAFWPSYIALGIAGSDAYIHLHAFGATLWMFMLIAQPLAIRHRRMPLHRAVGKSSYILAPLIVVSVLLLANLRINQASGEMIPVQRFILYLQMSAIFLFSLSYALAIAYRTRPSFHARFMICTGLTLIDPIVARMVLAVNPAAGPIGQIISYGITDLILIVLIFLERRSPNGREVFPVMLAVFALVQLPLFLGVTDSEAWLAFAGWFAALPLT